MRLLRKQTNAKLCPKGAFNPRRLITLFAASTVALTLLAGSAWAGVVEDAGFVNSLTGSQVPKAQPLVETGDVFSDFLTFMNNTSFKFRIEVPWIERGANESDSDTLARVEGLLRDRFVKESNNKIEPSWIYSESIDFQRRTVCDQPEMALASSRKERIISQSDSGSGGVQVENSSASSSSRGTYADRLSRASERASSSESLSSFNGESYRVSGYTVIDVTDKTYVQLCKKRHVEFRGILQAERVLNSSAAHPRVKLFITFRAIDAMVKEFEQRRSTFADRLQYVLTEPRLRQDEIKTMGFVNGAAFINGMKKDLIELTTDYKSMLNIKAMFERASYTTFANYIGTQAEKMRLSLLSVASTLQPFGAVVQNEKKRRGSDEQKAVIGTEIVIGVTSGNRVTTFELFNVDELKNAFAGIIDFQFKGVKQNPYANSVEAVNATRDEMAKSLEDCQKFVQGLYQNSVKSALLRNYFSSFSDYIDRIKACTTKIDVPAYTYGAGVVDLMKGKACIPDLQIYDATYAYPYYSGSLYCL